MVDDLDHDLDVIEQQRGPLRAAFAQAAKDDDKKAIQAKLEELAELQEKTILGAFMTQAAKIQAMSDTLNGIIRDLKGHIDSFFLDNLKKIGTRNGLLPKKTKNTAPR